MSSFKKSIGLESGWYTSQFQRPLPPLTKTCAVWDTRVPNQQQFIQGFWVSTCFNMFQPIQEQHFVNWDPTPFCFCFFPCTHFVPTGYDFLSDFIQNSSRIQRTSTSSGHFRALEASSGIHDLTWMLSSVVPTAAFQKVGGSPNRRFGWWKWMIAYPSNTWTLK
jgi:hypothetical protein